MHEWVACCYGRIDLMIRTLGIRSHLNAKILLNPLYLCLSLRRLSLCPDEWQLCLLPVHHSITHHESRTYRYSEKSKTIGQTMQNVSKSLLQAPSGGFRSYALNCNDTVIICRYSVVNHPQTESTYFEVVGFACCGCWMRNANRIDRKILGR